MVARSELQFGSSSGDAIELTVDRRLEFEVDPGAGETVAMPGNTNRYAWRRR